ncbi:MAG: hypothetical protein F6K23_28115 [Okeania sp. SIO2C9]|uniref:hypothetical protein n=1 Tax=Okeania sp. SIO2C9 TaxID=2607791 RepID=UPI0013BF1E54|nr:hypothetical protein [Okeania sp. SIO2C9]NEQ76558.1 hypothetical protein [Okeania sp. SIO2C9]
MWEVWGVWGVWGGWGVWGVWGVFTDAGSHQCYLFPTTQRLNPIAQGNKQQAIGKYKRVFLRNAAQTAYIHVKHLNA